jgi:hypothetical protein
MFPKTGKRFLRDVTLPAPTYAALIAEILRTELANNPTLLGQTAPTELVLVRSLEEARAASP